MTINTPDRWSRHSFHFEYEGCRYKTWYYTEKNNVDLMFLISMKFNITQKYITYYFLNL